MAVAEIWG